MVQKILKRKNSGLLGNLLSGKKTEARQALLETAGLWRGRKVDPISYQRKMRKSYTTVHTSK